MNDGNGNDSGHVRVYDYMAVLGLSWAPTSTARRPVIIGLSVSLSSDGTRVAIGAL